MGDVTKSCLNRVWKQNLVWSSSLIQELTPSVVEKIVEFIKSASFDKGVEENVEELPNLHRQELINEDLIELLTNDGNEEINICGEN